jgi:hypothetical protein
MSYLQTAADQWLQHFLITIFRRSLHSTLFSIFVVVSDDRWLLPVFHKSVNQQCLIFKKQLINGCNTFWLKYSAGVYTPPCFPSVWLSVITDDHLQFSIHQWNSSVLSSKSSWSMAAHFLITISERVYAPPCFPSVWLSMMTDDHLQFSIHQWTRCLYWVYRVCHSQLDTTNLNYVNWMSYLPLNSDIILYSCSLSMDAGLMMTTLQMLTTVWSLRRVSPSSRCKPNIKGCIINVTFATQLNHNILSMSVVYGQWPDDSHTPDVDNCT